MKKEKLEQIMESLAEGGEIHKCSIKQNDKKFN